MSRASGKGPAHATTAHAPPLHPHGGRLGRRLGRLRHDVGHGADRHARRLRGRAGAARGLGTGPAGRRPRRRDRRARGGPRARQGGLRGHGAGGHRPDRRALPDLPRRRRDRGDGRRAGGALRPRLGALLQRRARAAALPPPGRACLLPRARRGARAHHERQPRRLLPRRRGLRRRARPLAPARQRQPRLRLGAPRQGRQQGRARRRALGRGQGAVPRVPGALRRSAEGRELHGLRPVGLRGGAGGRPHGAGRGARARGPGRAATVGLLGLQAALRRGLHPGLDDDAARGRQWT